MFIATPGGLDDERKTFRRALGEFNDDDAYERGVAFIPVGWELTLAGAGRPQEIINEELRRCDYLVLVLWDRWGSPPATDGPYTSGTEEEYAVARECLSDVESRMRDIVVLFKGVDPRQLSDPGDQLRKVLAFKKTLEEQKAIYYATFDSLDEFERDLRRHLLRWTRDEHGPTPTKPLAPPPPSHAGDSPPLFDVPPRATDDDSTELLEQANRFADEGRLAEAESLYARAVVARTDTGAMTKYTRFLRRTGRLDLALAMADRLLEVGRQLADPQAQIEALSNIALIERDEGNVDRAIGLLNDAVALAENMGPDGASELAFLHDNIGLALRRQGRFKDALLAYQRALEIRGELDDKRGIANTSNNLGVLQRLVGELELAKEQHLFALQTFQELGYKRGQAITYAYLGEAHEALGEIDEARDAFLTALQLDEELKSPQGTSWNLCQLGRLALSQGETSEATAYAERALEAGEHLGNRQGIAAAYHLLGQIETQTGDLPTALDDLHSAVALYRDLDHRLGTAWALADLSIAQLNAGDRADAQSTFTEASTIAGSLIHTALHEHIASIIEQLGATDGDEGSLKEPATPD